ncbi:hypothetical protein B566_EDAN006197 [Ephemera danica]|nr:hypothetical protein B566_EDAN006197 [Ephemera danica]
MGRLSDVDKGRIIQLWDDGSLIAEIARHLNFAHSTVKRWVDRHEAEGHVRVRPVPGRPRVTTAAIDQQIRQLSAGDHFMNSNQIRQQLNLQCCRNTIKQRLRVDGIFARWAAKKQALTPAHIQQRLTFAQQYDGRDMNFWRKVIFTDECVFSSDINGRFVVYRPRGLRHHQDYVKLVHKSGRFSVSVWAWISHEGVGMLYEIDGRLTGIQYRAILRDVMFPSVTARFDNGDFFFMHDRSPIHTSHVARDWVAQQGIRVLNWPPRGADMNPIEHVWAEMKRTLNDMPNVPRNRDELSQRITQVWDELIDGPRFVQILVESVPDRLAGVIQANGFWTRY